MSIKKKLLRSLNLISISKYKSVLNENRLSFLVSPNNINIYPILKSLLENSNNKIYYKLVNFIVGQLFAIILTVIVFCIIDAIKIVGIETKNVLYTTHILYQNDSIQTVSTHQAPYKYFQFDENKNIVKKYVLKRKMDVFYSDTLKLPKNRSL